MATELSGFTVYVRPELLNALKAQAEREDRTLSNFVARYLEGLWHPQEGFPLIASRGLGAAEGFHPSSGGLAGRQGHQGEDPAIRDALGIAKRGGSKAAKHK
jgi:hypothetical protein